VTFGKQEYIPLGQTDLVACNFSAMIPNERCVISQLSRLQDAILTQMPVLGNIYFFSNIIFLVVFVLACLISAARARRSDDGYAALGENAAAPSKAALSTLPLPILGCLTIRQSVQFAERCSCSAATFAPHSRVEIPNKSHWNHLLRQLQLPESAGMESFEGEADAPHEMSSAGTSNESRWRDC
jgi:hypothetical protein